MATDIFTSSGTWTCPAGVTSVQVECFGGGGGGGSDRAAAKSGGGGGGGAYSKRNSIRVVPSYTYTVTVAASVNPKTNGSSSVFTGEDLVTCVAVGGMAGGTYVGKFGGNAASGSGDVKYSGGNGGSSVGSLNAGGGGGEGAYESGNGNNGSDSDGGNTGGAGGTGSDGGDGGAGGDYLSDGLDGTAIGGGGGGISSDATTSGMGARGEVRITYAVQIIPRSAGGGAAYSSPMSY